MFDVIVIGGGVVGASVLRSLAKYDLNICMLEKEADVSTGASCANSGVAHAGFDAPENSLKAKFNVEGSEMMESLCSELGVKYKRNGSLVVAFTEEDLKTLDVLYQRGIKNGVKGLEIISKERLKQLEPNVSDAALGALLANTGGILCPYSLTFALIGNAMDNGASLMLEFDVARVEKLEEGYKLYSSDGKTVEGKIIVNCAGLGAEKVAKLFGDDSVKIGARKGEYMLLDKSTPNFVKHTMFFTPTKAGKGVLVLPTVDGNILLGPTSQEQACDTDTTPEGLNFIKERTKTMCPNIPFANQITSFAGVRAYSHTHDFIVGFSDVSPNLIHCAGIESPGLTSAPAIGEYVAKGLIGGLLPLKKKRNFNPYREKDHYFLELGEEEKNELIKKDKRYGNIVCWCETITEKEVIDACTKNPKATTIDGVKRRTRAGMGKCQGGFCQPAIAEIISECNKINQTEVTKNGKGSELFTGVTK